MATKKINALLREQMDDKDGTILPLPVRVDVNGIENILIRAKGYGDYCSAKGEGYPILIEQANGVLRVIVWADINQEDPTHIIELGNALESKREEEIPEGATPDDCPNCSILGTAECSSCPENPKDL